MSFWAVLMSNSFLAPNYTDLIRLTEAMILSEQEPDIQLLQEVYDIYDSTDPDLNINLASLEMLVFHQLHHPTSSLNKELEIDGKSYKLIDLYKYLDKCNQKLVRIVIEIAKKYSLDIPMGMSTTSKMSF